MRKSKMVLLAAALAVAVSAPAVSADRAGIGLNWAIGPMVQLGPFDMKFSNGFTLGWNVTDRFSVGVFREDAQVRGEYSYTNNPAAPTVPVKHTVVVEGTTNAQGLRFMANLLALPIVGELSAGIEVGTQVINAATFTYTNDDGTMDVDGVNFGTAPAADVDGLVDTVPLMGVAGNLRVLEFETKTVTTAVDVNASFRFIPVNDTYTFGTQETDYIPPAGTTFKKIDPVSNFNTLSLTVGVGIWF